MCNCIEIQTRKAARISNGGGVTLPALSRGLEVEGRAFLALFAYLSTLHRAPSLGSLLGRPGALDERTMCSRFG
jgi:hypothetical protein